ncbi:hypothetical protein, partial [Bacteroides stercoris]|uniref:hypothetical protein n=1 Tax=Bacteroides stercoris TaxID=46506 RepID=UPI003AF22718
IQTKKDDPLKSLTFGSPSFFLLYISQVQIKKKKKTFASYKKIRTFASRLLSHKDKHLIHSGLISLCPRRLIRGEAKI